MEVQSNTNVVIKCDATGFPLVISCNIKCRNIILFYLIKPNISWSYEGQSLDDYDFIEYLGDGEILLRNVTVTSEGGYVCNAFNDIGNTQKVFYIIVNGSSNLIF